jgi:hypothetical protein
MPIAPSQSDLKTRVSTPSADALTCCSVPGCGRAPEARQGNGLSPFLCRYHREFRSRHGSPIKRSYTGPHLRPYVRAAEVFVKANAADQYVEWAVQNLASLIASSGPVRRVADLGRLAPADKARAALAMLREREVPPARILAVVLGVAAAIEEDPFGPGGDRALFRRVQIAKALRRRASGTHVVYEGTGRRLDRYPRSSGRVLEALGAAVETACEFPLAHHLAAVLALKQARHGRLEAPPLAPIAKSRHGNAKIPAPPPAVSLKERDAEAKAEREEADRILDEVRRDFARRGFDSFKEGL